MMRLFAWIAALAAAATPLAAETWDGQYYPRSLDPDWWCSEDNTWVYRIEDNRIGLAVLDQQNSNGRMRCVRIHVFILTTPGGQVLPTVSECMQRFAVLPENQGTVATVHRSPTEPKAYRLMTSFRSMGGSVSKMLSPGFKRSPPPPASISR